MKKMRGSTSTAGRSVPPWRADGAPTGPSAPPGTHRCDVCVVGGGIAGVTTALLLQEAGRSVILLEDGRIGSGETGRTTAHLASALDDRFSRLIRLHGEEGARLAYRSHAAAIEEIERLVLQHRIDCGFERLDGYLFSPPGADPDVLRDELQAARSLGVEGVRRVKRAPLRGFDTGPCLLFPRQGQFHPMRYLGALARALVDRGGRVYERTHVTELTAGSPAIVGTEGGALVSADAVVIATNAPVVSRISVPLRQYPYRTYALGLSVPKGAVPNALFWDTEDPYHYVRVQSVDGEEILIAGGEDHKTGQPGESASARFDRLEAWARERFDGAGPVRFAWSGQVMEPADGLAYIGLHEPAGKNVYIATGDSGHGMTHGTIAGILLRDEILGRDNPWTELYRPSRTTLKSLAEIAKENLKTLPAYGSWLTGGETRTTRAIPRGEGRVLRDGLRKIACHRDDAGRLCSFSAACPHLGAVVAWNDVEKTWDCPAHGSRFSALGKVLNGPANSDLKEVARRRRATG